MAEHKIAICGCETAWDELIAAGVTSVLDNADYKVGAGSAKISPDATVVAGTILATEAMAPVDLSDCKIAKLWIKSSVDTELGDLQILLDNHANCASPEEALDVPALSAGIWSLCDLPLANPESDTAIISVGLKYVTDLGACDIRVDDVNGCIVTPEYAQTLIRGWYPTLDKSIPVKVGDDGTVQVFDPAVFNSLVVYEGTATADGPNTSTITDTVLATKPDFNGQLVVITSGDYKGQTRNIDQATNTGGGKVHVAAAFGGTIVSGVTFVILSIRPTTAEVADIEAKLDHADHGLPALKTLLDAILLDTGTTLETKLDNLKTVTDAILVDTETTLEDKLDAIDALVDAVEAKLDHVDHGLAALKNLIDAIENKLDHATYGLSALKTEIDANETKIDTVDTVVDGIQTDLSNATDGLGALKALIDGVETKVDTVDTVVDGIQTDLSNATDGLGALKALIDTVDTVVDGIQTDLDNATDGLGALKALIDDLDADLVAAKTVIDDIHDTDLPAVKTDTAAIKTQTDKLAGEAPVESSVSKNWNTAVDSPDGTGGLLVNLGTAATRKKLHSLLLDVSALTDGAIIHVKLFIKINDTQRKVYDETFTIATNPSGLWVINGSLVIHDILSVAIYSDTDEGKAVGYTACLEAM